MPRVEGEKGGKELAAETGRQVFLPESSHSPGKHCSVPMENSSALKSSPCWERKIRVSEQLA